MNPELTKLLDLQRQDLAIAEIDVRIETVRRDRGALDTSVAQARAAVAAAERGLLDAKRKRDEVELKVESLRALQDRRRQRMEQVKTAREAQALTMELDLARSTIAKEESEWLKLADQVSQIEASLAQAGAALAALDADQTTARAAIDEREATLNAERAEAKAGRERAAAEIDRPLFHRYARLRSSRTDEVVVPLHGTACGACFTAVPMNRRGQIRAGLLVEGCEACGVILYAANERE